MWIFFFRKTILSDFTFYVDCDLGFAGGGRVGHLGRP